MAKVQQVNESVFDIVESSRRQHILNQCLCKISTVVGNYQFKTKMQRIAENREKKGAEI